MTPGARPWSAPGDDVVGVGAVVGKSEARHSEGVRPPNTRTYPPCYRTLPLRPGCSGPSAHHRKKDTEKTRGNHTN